MRVICCKVNDSCLGWCIHSEEHEPDIHAEHGSCTKWGSCVQKYDDTLEIKARCTKVKEESGEKNIEK